MITIHHGVAAYEKGNAALKSEHGYKWITTAEYKGNPFRLELSIYANLITNYIYLNPSGKLYENMRGVFPSFDYEQTNAFFTGIDWLGWYQLSTAIDNELKASIVQNYL